MDLLYYQSQEKPFGDIPYVYHGGQRWDGGDFLTYPRRRGMNHLVSPIIDDPSEATKSTFQQSSEVVTAVGSERLQFLQTWLYFGLAAELLGLNVQPDGSRLLDETAASVELDELYASSVAQHNGGSVVSGRYMSERGPLLIERLRLYGKDPGALSNRVAHLNKCLQVTYQITCGWSNHHFIDDIKYPHLCGRYAISALAERMTMEVYTAMVQKTLTREYELMVLDWSAGLLARGISAESRMLKSGWCMGDIERLRQLCTGLNTVHHISHLALPTGTRDHTSCDIHLCRTAQINVADYHTVHIDRSCDCSDIRLDTHGVDEILTTTASYPVLCLDASDITGDVQTTIEEYSAEQPYVALSHVWADGLGNPHANTLPSCQIKRLFSLVSAIGVNDNAQSSKADTKRMWIDTLCCPVEGPSKAMALQRMADVYRNAEAVLVLDSALLSVAVASTSIVELGLRVFASTTWMRRLWTLQEGALARKLYFQFSDTALEAYDIRRRFFIAGLSDSRLMRMYQQFDVQLLELFSFNSGILNTQYTKQFEFKGSTLYSLQRALYFQGVSVSSDEALCVATLMDLDISYIIATNNSAQRISRIWQCLSLKYGGLPARVIFGFDSRLDIPGWRWAPRSFLRPSTPPYESLLQRSALYGLSYLNEWPSQGTPTPEGFKAQYSGYSVRSEPYSAGSPPHIWGDAEKELAPETAIHVYCEQTGDYFGISDAYRLTMSSVWSEEELAAYDQANVRPLCTTIDEGGCVLIKDPAPEGHTCWLARLEPQQAYAELGTESEPLKVHLLRQVRLFRRSSAVTTFLKSIHRLSREIALDIVRKKRDQDELTSRDLIQTMKDATDQLLESQPQLAGILERDLYLERDLAWRLILRAPHMLTIQALPDNQWWLID